MSMATARSRGPDVAAGAGRWISRAARARTGGTLGLIACHECEAEQVAPRSRAADGGLVCFRCRADLPRQCGGAVGVSAHTAGLDEVAARVNASSQRALSLVVATLPLFVGSQLFPLLRLDHTGNRLDVTIASAARALAEQDLGGVAALMVLTTVLLPGLRLCGAAYLFAGLRVRRPLPGVTGLLRLLSLLRPWSQLDILLVAVGVAFGKLATVFRIVPGVGLLCMVAVLVMEKFIEHAVADLACPPSIKPRELGRLRDTVAPLVAAALLFVPANLLPVMTTTTLVKQHRDTVLSGVAALWHAGAGGLAVLVFVASILVPAVKIIALAVLVVTTWRRSAWRRRERARLYRVLEVVGRWSMLDLFVMGLLAALVRSRMADVHVESGALVFAAVVVLTMIASHRFDPRLIWVRARTPFTSSPLSQSPQSLAER